MKKWKEITIPFLKAGAGAAEDDHTDEDLTASLDAFQKAVQSDEGSAAQRATDPPADPPTDPPTVIKAKMIKGEDGKEYEEGKDYEDKDGKKFMYKEGKKYMKAVEDDPDMSKSIILDPDLGDDFDPETTKAIIEEIGTDDPDDDSQEFQDAGPMLKSIAKQVGHNTGVIHEEVKELRKTVGLMAKCINALMENATKSQETLTKVADSGAGRKSNLHILDEAQMKKAQDISQNAWQTIDTAMAKALEAKTITGRDVAVLESYMNKGLTVLQAKADRPDLFRQLEAQIAAA